MANGDDFHSRFSKRALHGESTSVGPAVRTCVLRQRSRESLIYGTPLHHETRQQSRGRRCDDAVGGGLRDGPGGCLVLSCKWEGHCAALYGIGVF